MRCDYCPLGNTLVTGFVARAVRAAPVWLLVGSVVGTERWEEVDLPLAEAR